MKRKVWRNEVFLVLIWAKQQWRCLWDHSPSCHSEAVWDNVPDQSGCLDNEGQSIFSISSDATSLHCSSAWHVFSQRLWKQKMCNWENKEHAKEMWDNEENFQCVRWFLTSEQWSEGQFDWQRFWPLTHRQDWHPSVHSDPGCDTNTRYQHVNIQQRCLHLWNTQNLSILIFMFLKNALYC